MEKDKGYIKARLKTYELFVEVYPEAKHWGRPISCDHLFPSADENILPYLGKTIWLQKKRQDLFRFYFEFKDADGFIALPNWIQSFDSPKLVPPAEWNDPYDGRVDDIWLDPYKERWIILDDLLIVTG